MVLTFFKASKPYDTTNGFWEGRIWTHGFTGPLSIREAQRLSSMLGGRYFDINLPEINTITELLHKLGAELPSEVTDVQRPAAQYVPAPVDDPDAERQKAERNLAILVEAVMGATNSENRERLEKFSGTIPAYAEQVKILADSKKDFDYVKYIGRKRDVSSILKAYTIFILRDKFTLEGVLE